MAKGDSRIFITVEGGLVSGVFSSNPDDNVTIIDQDFQDEEEERDCKRLLRDLDKCVKNGTVGQIY